ncbi:MAG: hypothetical protein COV71_06540 [Candidatus Omnitrophica bacterium CG11_big_fil_rev_8_21_14_0_20_41_12]|nr:MAG: hypothetical protein COV71_06540 [Candidatus Omnitrophica bacterium CG11_big_fil_rev_8_21_14_0_20_41_12]
MIWEAQTQNKFKILISKIPVFHRRITESVVTQQAEKIAAGRNCNQVEDQDVIAAFFTDVPSPFYSMMVRLLGQNGFDYKKYGFPREDKS